MPFLDARNEGSPLRKRQILRKEERVPSGVIVTTPAVEALLALLSIDAAREALYLPTALVGSYLGRREDSVGAAVRGPNAFCLRVLQQDEEEAEVLKILVVENSEIDFRWAERLSYARHAFQPSVVRACGKSGTRRARNSSRPSLLVRYSELGAAARAPSGRTIQRSSDRWIRHPTTPPSTPTSTSESEPRCS